MNFEKHNGRVNRRARPSALDGSVYMNFELEGIKDGEREREQSYMSMHAALLLALAKETFVDLLLSL